MKRSERTGFIVSGAGHLGLFLWAILGGIFFNHDMPPAVATTEVSLMSSAEFAALQAAAPKAAVESPPQPSLPEAGSETPPAPVDETPPDAATPTPPEAQPVPDAAPEVTELTPPAAEVTDTPPTPTTTPVAEPSATVTPDTSPRPKPKPAPRVAPTPSEAPAPDAQVADTAVAETTPAPSEEAVPTPVEPTDATAPPETGDVIQTEDNANDVPASAAPLTSGRPKPRPEKKPAPAEPAAAPAETQTASANDAPTEDAVADALAEALSGEASNEPAPGTGTAPSGPPLTGGEKDGMIVAVKQCWNVGSLSTDALRTVVTVGVSMGENGMPDAGSIHMIGFEGGDEASAQQAYEAGRRAILRCAKDGYDLPVEKYGQWREIEIVFNPEKMRLR